MQERNIYGYMWMVDSMAYHHFLAPQLDSYEMMHAEQEMRED
jgi:hypothetical protein